MRERKKGVNSANIHTPTRREEEDHRGGQRNYIMIDMERKGKTNNISLDS